MDALELLFSSRVKARIFRLLFGPGAPEFHIRELARRAGLHEATVRQELKSQARQRLVLARVSGNRTYYRAHAAHPLAAEIRSLALKTGGMAEALSRALAKAEVRAAFIFGSIADGTETPESDVDLMIIGPLSLREASVAVAGTGASFGREVNPHVLTAKEFARRRAAGDHFVHTVMRGPKVFLVGSERELEAMG